MSSHIGKATVLAARLALMVSMLVLIVAYALELGAWRTSETFKAPFAHESSGTTKALVVRLGTSLPLPGLFGADGDTLSQQHRSSLRLLVGDKPLGPPHAVHETIRKQGGGAYSHWGDYLLFSLPDGIDNQPGTKIRVEYSVRLRPIAWIMPIAWITLFGATGFLAWQLKRRHQPALERYLTRAVTGVGRLISTHIEKATLVAARLVLMVSMLVLVVAYALELGAWTTSETFKAPFAHESSGTTKALVVRLGTSLPLPGLFSADGDTLSQQHRSSLRLLVGDKPLGPPHAVHETIRKQGGGRTAIGAITCCSRFPTESITNPAPRYASSTL